MNQVLRLDGGDCTLLLLSGGGAPVCAYWGPWIDHDTGVAELVERAKPHGMLDDGETLDLYPEAGRGFTGREALVWRRDDGAFVSQLQHQAATAVPGGWDIRLVDSQAGLEVCIQARMHPTGVAAFRSQIRNSGDGPLSLDWAAACSLPLPHDEVLSFDGRWAGEFRTVRTRVPSGLFAKENRTGRTSHHAPPFLVVGEPGFGEHHGEVIGLHLAWSGNSRMFVERLRDGRLQAQGGEIFLPGEVRLEPHETYETPWLYAAWSAGGLNGLSDRFHPFVRDEILGGRLRGKRRPVHFNTWEAVYFRHDVQELMALAAEAKAVGAERFVLDDGWFRNRHSDKAGLGDWTADEAAYPGGLGPLIGHVRSLGLEFGLWVEPEMANADSDLLRAHPDWILHVPGREQPVGRGQYVLDLTRREVADNIYRQLDRLLSDHEIGYLKWDMNRDLTHAASGGGPAARRQVQAVYALIDKLRAAHPQVEIEACASGGARADYEILRRTDRIWTSDCNDPFERQKIQRAFSIFFPPEVMGSHVGPRESHTTARVTSLELRALTALFGHMGMEADIRAFSAEDRAALAQAIALHKSCRDLLHQGRLVRQVREDAGAVGFLVAGEREALASLAQVETPAYPAPAPFRLVGLEPDAAYRVRLLNPPAKPAASMKSWPSALAGEPFEATGLAIQTVGLPLPVLRAGELSVFHLQRI
jgi:alpha-galactosidase